MSLEIIDKNYTKVWDDMLAFFKSEYPLLEFPGVPFSYNDHNYRYVFTRAKPLGWFGRHIGEFMGSLGSEGTVHAELQLWIVNSDNKEADVQLRKEYDSTLITKLKSYLEDKGFYVKVSLES
jgi:hypothetical protein